MPKIPFLGEGEGVPPKKGKKTENKQCHKTPIIYLGICVLGNCADCPLSFYS